MPRVTLISVMNMAMTYWLPSVMTMMMARLQYEKLHTCCRQHTFSTRSAHGQHAVGTRRSAIVNKRPVRNAAAS